MNARLWITLLALVALQAGCGKQDTPPQAVKPATEMDRVADDAKRAVERETQRVYDDWNGLVSDAKKNANKVQNDLKSQVTKQRDEMAEFAAEMAEDAKDRALDIPDVLDEFFGAPGEFRRGSRSDRPRR